MLSRVADACYWMSRYIERAENNARILDVNMQLLLDYENSDQDPALRWQPILASLEEQELFFKLHDTADGESVMDFLAFEKANPDSILSCIAKARENARTVREQISSSMWEQLNRLYLYLRSPACQSDFLSSPSDYFQHIISCSHLFQGITDCTMTHADGWHFIQFGKYLERADSTSRLLDMKYHTLLPSGEVVGGSIDLTQWMAVLRSCSAMEPFLKRYVGQVTPWHVGEFLILDDSFPRSIRFCVDRLDRALHHVSGTAEAHFANEAERLSGMLRSGLDFATIEGIFNGGLHEYLDQTQLRLIEISAAMTRAYCKWMDASAKSRN